MLDLIVGREDKDDLSSVLMDSPVEEYGGRGTGGTSERQADNRYAAEDIEKRRVNMRVRNGIRSDII